MTERRYNIDAYRSLDQLLLDHEVVQLSKEDPRFGVIYRAWVKFEPDPGQDWETLGRELRESLPARRLEMLSSGQSPFIADGVAFVTLVGIADNPQIDLKDKQAFMSGFFPPEENNPTK